MATKIRAGDRVMVISGSNKGQIGVVKDIKNNRATVDSVNLVVKHQKAKGNEKGQMKFINGSIDMSNLSHVNEDDRPVRVSFIYEDGKKFLVQRKDHSRKIRQV